MILHPVAQLFPPMSEAQYNALREDIRENGQREPITLWRGQVIDGLHRAKACDELRRLPITREWDGEESALIGYVVSLNLHRRHLSESQRAMVAEKIAQNASEAALAREASRRGEPGTSIDVSGKVPVTIAADLLNVSVPSVNRARRVRATGTPELVAAVERGDISVYSAAEIAKRSDAEQRVALRAPRGPRNQHTGRNPATATAERVNRTVESLVNLSELLTEALPQMNGDKRRPEWATRLREVRTTITRFIVECEK